MVKCKNKKYFSDIAIPPGETLLEMLEVNNMTQAELAARIDFSKKHINKIIKGEAPITAETAVKLENIFSLPASFWTNLEANYREDLARLNEKQDEEEKEIAKVLPYSEMVKYNWLPDASEVEEKIYNLRDFFRVASLTLIKGTSTYSVAFRTANADQASSLALAAWKEQGRSIAKEIETDSFSKEKVEERISVFRKMTNESPMEFFPNLVTSLSECGIAFAIVPNIQKTYAHGAVSWLSKDKVLMQLSLRYKYSDIFWFSFFHELGHILLHGKRDEFIEYENRDKNKKEDEADEFAANILIPKEKYEKFLWRRNFKVHSIIRFAKEIGVSPSIVIGRLQYDRRFPHYFHNKLRTQYYYSDFKKEY